MCCDRYWLYLIANIESFKAAEPMYQDIWRQVLDTPYSDAWSFGIDNNHPRLVKPYYYICADIEQYNNKCKYYLELECIIKTYDWSNLVILLILCMVMVYTTNLYTAWTDYSFIYTTPKNLYKDITHKIIDKKIDDPRERTTG